MRLSVRLFSLSAVAVDLGSLLRSPQWFPLVLVLFLDSVEKHELLTLQVTKKEKDKFMLINFRKCFVQAI